jgi:hypothetical protein
VDRGSASRPAPSPPAVTAIRVPDGWTATPTSVRALLSRALGSTTTAPRYGGSDGLLRVRAASCANGLCAVAYNVDFTARLHTVRQMVEQQGGLLGAAFGDRSLRGISLTAWGPSKTAGRVAQNPIFTLNCSRVDLGAADPTRMSASQLMAACAYVPYVANG